MRVCMAGEPIKGGLQPTHTEFLPMVQQMDTDSDNGDPLGVSMGLLR